MKLLFDENVPKILVDHFRQLGINLKTVRELDLIQTPDKEIVKRSNKLRRTLVTRDLGIIKIISYSDAIKHGLVLIRKRGKITSRLLDVITNFTLSFKKRSLKDALVVIDEEKYEIFKGRFHEYSPE